MAYGLHRRWFDVRCDFFIMRNGLGAIVVTEGRWLGISCCGGFSFSLCGLGGLLKRLDRFFECEAMCAQEMSRRRTAVAHDRSQHDGAINCIATSPRRSGRGFKNLTQVGRDTCRTSSCTAVFKPSQVD